MQGVFKFSCRSLLICTALFLLPMAARAGNGGVSPELLAGGMESNLKPQAGMSVQWGRAVAVMDAPLAIVTSVVEDYAGYQRFLPNFEASRVLSQRQASALVYVQLSVLNGARKLWAELRLRAHEGDGSTHLVEAKMVKGNVSHFEALWELTAVDAHRTLVAFQILVDPDMPVPSSLLSNENGKSARKTLRALRTQLAQHKLPGR